VTCKLGKLLTVDDIVIILFLGHTVECGTFLLREAIRTKSKDLKTFTMKHFIDQPLEYGEDEKFGGYFYYLDVDGES